MSSNKTNKVGNTPFAQFIGSLCPYRDGAAIKKVADSVGVTTEMVRLWKIGAHNPNVEQLIKLSNATGVSINRLMTGRDIEGGAESGSEYKPKNKERHDLLEKILCSGATDAIDIITLALKTWAERIEEGKMVKGRLDEIDDKIDRMERNQREIVESLKGGASSAAGAVRKSVARQ